MRDTTGENFVERKGASSNLKGLLDDCGNYQNLINSAIVQLCGTRLLKFLSKDTEHLITTISYSVSCLICLFGFRVWGFGFGVSGPRFSSFLIIVVKIEQKHRHCATLRVSLFSEAAAEHDIVTPRDGEVAL